jgi:hypothetical protein
MRYLSVGAANFILPLLRHQPHLASAEVFRFAEEIDLDLDLFRRLPTLMLGARAYPFLTQSPTRARLSSHARDKVSRE